MVQFFKILAVAVCATFVAPAYALESIGKVTALRGMVTAENETGETTTLAVGSAVFQGQLIITAKNAKAQLVLNDDSVFTIGEDTELLLDEYVYNPDTDEGRSVIESSKGIFKFLTGKIAKKDPENVKLNTPFATIGVRGSGGIVKVDGTGQTTLNMTECCLNIAPRNGSSMPVELKQINTFSKVEAAGAPATDPEPAPLDMVIEFEGAVNVQVEAVEEVPTKKDDRAEKPKEKSKENPKKEVKREKQAAVNNQAQQSGEGAEDDAAGVADNATEVASDDVVSGVDGGEADGSDGASIDERLDAFIGGVIGGNNQEGESLVGDDEENEPVSNRFGQVIKRTGALGSATFADVGEAEKIQVNGNTVLSIKNPAGKQIGVRLTGDYGRLNQTQVRVNGEPVNGRVWESPNGEFYIVQYTTLLGQREEFVVGNEIDVADLEDQDDISFFKMNPDIFGSTGSGAVSTLRTDLVLDSRDGKNNVIGGSVKLDGVNSKLNALIGRITAATGVDGDAFTYGTGGAENSAVSTEKVYGLEDSVEAVYLDNGLATSAFSEEVQQVQNQKITEQDLSSEGQLKGYAAGFMKLNGDVQRVSNNTATGNVTMDIHDSTGQFDAQIKTYDSGNDYYIAKFGEADGGTSSYVSNNMWGATLGDVDMNGTYSTSENAVILSSAFVEGVPAEYKNFDFMTWGVWAGEFETVSGVGNKAMFIPFVVGQETGDISDGRLGALGNQTYNGVLVGAVADGSGVSHDTGEFKVNVDFNKRELSGFEGNVNGYNLTQTGGSKSVDSGFANGINLNVASQSTPLLGNGTGTANAALFGGDAENIGGNYQFEAGQNVEGSGIFAGKR